MVECTGGHCMTVRVNPVCVLQSQTTASVTRVRMEPTAPTRGCCTRATAHSATQAPTAKAVSIYYLY